jgi:hypothetical protein
VRVEYTEPEVKGQRSAALTVGRAVESWLLRVERLTARKFSEAAVSDPPKATANVRGSGGDRKFLATRVG